MQKQKRIAPVPEAEEVSLVPIYPTDVGDDFESKLQYSKDMCSVWASERMRLEAEKVARDRMGRNRGDGEGTPSSATTKEMHPRDTVTASEELRTISSRQFGRSHDLMSNGGNAVAVCEQMVIRPVMKSLRGQKDRSVGKVFLGGRWSGPYLVTYFFNLLLYSLGALTAFLSLWNFLPRKYIYFGILGLPHLIQDILEINIDIARLVIRQPSNYVFWLWVVILCGGLAIEYSGQDHYAGVVFVLGELLWSLTLIPFFDALPLHERTLLNKLVLPVCNMLFMALVVSLRYNWAGSEGYALTFAGHINLTSAGMAMAACNNVIVLLTLNIFTAFLRPNLMVTVRSGVEALQMPEGEAVTIRSYDTLAHETALKYRAERSVGLKTTLQAIFIRKLKPRLSRPHGQFERPTISRQR
jgi:hypothetical protein